MARFENSREGNTRGPKRSFGNRDSDGRKSFGDRSGKSRDYGRDPSKFNRNSRDVKLTKVTCASCGKECEVPFKPTSNKPVYCRECFSGKGNSNENRSQSRDSNNDLSKELKIINEKLDKIIESLDAE